SQRLEEVQQELELLRGEIRKLKADLFGRKSEKQSRKDRSNDLEDPQETAAKTSSGPAARPARSQAPRLCAFAATHLQGRVTSRTMPLPGLRQAAETAQRYGRCHAN